MVLEKSITFRSLIITTKHFAVQYEYYLPHCFYNTVSNGFPTSLLEEDISNDLIQESRFKIFQMA
jgi:hypothetical protein